MTSAITVSRYVFSIQPTCHLRNTTIRQGGGGGGGEIYRKKLSKTLKSSWNDLSKFKLRFWPRIWFQETINIDSKQQAKNDTKKNKINIHVQPSC